MQEYFKLLLSILAAIVVYGSIVAMVVYMLLHYPMPN